ncbi:MAG: AbrB/MazE/SpoVT family DNA-binding domain-containing protein [Pseudomonadota bacterium]
MSKSKTWKVHLIDTGDGTGDAIIELPDDLLAETGWAIGDVIDVEPGDGCVFLKVSNEIINPI